MNKTAHAVSKMWPVNAETTFLAKPFQGQDGYDRRPQTAPFCILATASRYGTIGFARISGNYNLNQLLYEGLFEGDLAKSGIFLIRSVRGEPVVDRQGG